MAKNFYHFSDHNGYDLLVSATHEQAEAFNRACDPDACGLSLHEEICEVGTWMLDEAIADWDCAYSMKPERKAAIQEFLKLIGETDV